MNRYRKALGFARILAVTAMPMFMVFLPAAIPSDQTGVANAAARIDSPEGSMSTALDTVHDIGITGCTGDSPPPAHLSDTLGAFMLVQCEIMNFGDHDDMVEITAPGNVVETVLPAGCTASAVLVIPGTTSWVLLAGEGKLLLYRIKFQCHAPAIESIIPLTLRVAVDHVAQPGEPDDSNPDNDSVSLNKNLIIGPADRDGDGFTSAIEAEIGTRTDRACGHDGWPADLVDTGASFNKLDLQDLASFIAPARRLDTSPGDAGYSARWDLVPGAAAGSFINAQDIASLLPGNTTSTAWPPMLNGLPAFGHTCPSPP